MNLKDNIKDAIIEKIQSGDYDDKYVCDLANYMYNEDYYIIGTYQAKEFLKENFDEMFEALEDYKDNTGEQYPDIMNYEKLASLTVLNIAEKLIGEGANNCEDDIWNDYLNEDNKSMLIDGISEVSLD